MYDITWSKFHILFLYRHQFERHYKMHKKQEQVLAEAELSGHTCLSEWEVLILSQQVRGVGWGNPLGWGILWITTVIDHLIITSLCILAIFTQYMIYKYHCDHDSYQKPYMYSKTCLIQHVFGENSCIRIDRMSEYTVENI